MTFYLSTTDMRPVGVEPTEFLDLPPMAEVQAEPAPAGPSDLPPNKVRTAD